MSLALRDQSHIVTWLLPLVLYTSQFIFKVTQPTVGGAHLVSLLYDRLTWRALLGRPAR